MIERVAERFLNSLADASFWIFIIITIGVTFQKAFDFLFLSDIIQDKDLKKKETEEEE